MKQRNKNNESRARRPANPIAAAPKTPEPTLEQIRQRAREIFEARGQVPGHELNDWLQAEIELRSGAGQHGGKTAAQTDVIGRKAGLVIIWAATALGLGTVQAWSQTSAANSSFAEVAAWKPASPDIWQGGIGLGFKPGSKSVSIDAGAGQGVSIFGGRECHDLALAGASCGYMLGPVQGVGHWYRGNWEVRGELFSGGQFSPGADWLVGLTPHLRYNFATGTRWIPFFDAGAGVSATSIGPPDLSHTFEFNLQAATGVRWFIRNDVALGIEARYLHMSCAGLSTPNLGLNNVNGMVGITWFF